MKVKVSKEELEEWKEDMRREMPPGSRVFTLLRHVSRSGMQRKIGVYTFRPDTERPGEVIKRWWSYRVAAVLGWGFDDKTECVVVNGCGMDCGFHLIHELSMALYYKHEATGLSDHDAGYALNQEWL
jgi:hypothetical protein